MGWRTASYRSVCIGWRTASCRLVLGMHGLAYRILQVGTYRWVAVPHPAGQYAWVGVSILQVGTRYAWVGVPYRFLQVGMHGLAYRMEAGG